MCMCERMEGVQKVRSEDEGSEDGGCAESEEVRVKAVKMEGVQKVRSEDEGSEDGRCAISEEVRG